MRGTIQSLGILLWMTSFGCSTSVDVKPVEEENVQETLRLRLTATVSTDMALAGDILRYTVEVRDQNDNLIENNLTWSIESDIEEDLHTTNTTIMPVVAGEHTLGIRAVYTPTEDDFVAEGDISGIVLEQTLPLEVSPLSVEFLDLQIDKSVAQAGENIPYRVWALDRYGNRVRDPAMESEFEVSADSLNLTINSGQVYSTIADVYGISAWYGDIGDT